MKKKDGSMPLFGVGPLYGAVLLLMTAGAVLCGFLPALTRFRPAGAKLPLLLLGVALVLLGLWIWVQAVFVAKLDDRIKSGELVTTGVYAWVRNPIYTAILFACTGVLLMAGNVLFFPLAPLYWLFLTLLMIHTEEKWLRERFGKEYERYSARVNRCIPWFPRRDKE